MHVRLRLSKGWSEWCACWLSERSSIERPRRACYAPPSPLNTPSSLKTSGQQGRGKRATFTGHALLHTWDNAGRPTPTFQTYGKPGPREDITGVETPLFATARAPRKPSPALFRPNRPCGGLVSAPTLEQAKLGSEQSDSLLRAFKDVPLFALLAM